MRPPFASTANISNLLPHKCSIFKEEKLSHSYSKKSSVPFVFTVKLSSSGTLFGVPFPATKRMKQNKTGKEKKKNLRSIPRSTLVAPAPTRTRSRCPLLPRATRYADKLRRVLSIICFSFFLSPSFAYARTLSIPRCDHTQTILPQSLRRPTNTNNIQRKKIKKKEHSSQCDSFPT